GPTSVSPQHAPSPLRAGLLWLGLAACWLALAAAELAWFGWFLVEPLPNAANVGGTVRRWMFLGRALPPVIPGIGFGAWCLGRAGGELSHVEFLPQRLPVVAASGLIAAGALGLGGLVLRGLGLRRALTPAERLPLGFVLGASGLGMVTLVVG